MRMRVIGRYRSSFERQIGESVWLNSYLRDGVNILNSRNEYNRCKIPRLGLELRSEDALEEYRESQREAELKRELSKYREKMRDGKEWNKRKKRKVNKKEREKDEREEELSEKEEQIEKKRRERIEKGALYENITVGNIKRKRLKTEFDLRDIKKVEEKVKRWRERIEKESETTKERMYSELMLKVPERGEEEKRRRSGGKEEVCFGGELSILDRDQETERPLTELVHSKFGDGSKIRAGREKQALYEDTTTTVEAMSDRNVTVDSKGNSEVGDVDVDSVSEGKVKSVTKDSIKKDTIRQNSVTVSRNENVIIDTNIDVI